MFDSLLKIFRMTPESHQEIYKERYTAPFTVHLDFNIKQYNHKKSYPVFFSYNQELVLLLQNIYTSFQRFLEVLSTVPELVLHQFELSCLIDEVHSTSIIEGINSTHRELKEILDGDKHSVHFSSLIKKYYLLLSKDEIKFMTCEEVRRFYDEFAHREVIADNPANELDGEIFRKDIVDVRSATGKIIHRGLYPEDKIIEGVSTALSILNDEDIPALVRIAIFHYYFVYIHPFYDGNGRTARFITSCYVSSHLNYLLGLSLSVTIKRHRKKYYELINDTDNEFDCGELTNFIDGFLRIILETIREISNKLSKKMEQLEKFRLKLYELIPKDEISRKLGELLLQSSSFYGQGMSMEDIITHVGKSRNTVKKKLELFPKGLILVQSARKKYYKINPLLLRNDST